MKSRLTLQQRLILPIVLSQIFWQYSVFTMSMPMRELSLTGIWSAKHSWKISVVP